MFRIGEFSKLSNITVRMLRHYNEIGLLIPENIDLQTNYRYYTANQLITANKILVYRGIGFSLPVIKEIIESNDDKKVVEHYFNIRQIEINEEMDKIKNQIKMFDELSERVNNNMNNTEYNVVLKTIPERNVISLRKKIPAYDQEGTLWGEMYNHIGANKVNVLNDGYTMAIYHDKEYKESEVDVEVQSSIKGEYKDCGDIKFYKTQEMQVASVTFNGSYDQMSMVTQSIGSWIEQNNYQMSGVMFNIFHVSPSSTQNPDEWVTEACYPIISK